MIRAVADHLAALRQAMAGASLDGVLLASPSWSSAIVGHRRVAVHGPAGPLPTTVIGADGPPIVLTPDPDGAPMLPDEALLGIAWNPSTLVEAVRHALGGAVTVGIDVASPGALALLREALPGARFVDALPVITRALLAKDGAERTSLAGASAVAHRAAFAGLAGTGGGMDPLVRALEGAFPLADLILEPDRVVVEIQVGGFAGVARIGPADPGVLEEASRIIGHGAGQPLEELARRLPDGSAALGLGRGHEPPILQGGRAVPAGVTLPAGAVLLVTSGSAAVTVAVSEDDRDGESEPAWLSPPPAEVVR